MTEQVDLDALIAEARGFADWWHEDPQNSDLIYGIHRTGDAPGGKRVMEKREVSATSLRALADALESTLAELRQERAKVRGLGFSLEGTQAALSRAEETIARIRAARSNHPECDKVPDGISCGWKRAVQDIDAALTRHSRGGS